MSVFGTDQTPVGQAPVTGDPNATPSVVDQLVGEGKKFKTVEEALQGKVEADSYIDELKTKLSSLEAEVSKGSRIDELLSQLQDKAISPAPILETPNTDSVPQLDVSDLKSLVGSAISEQKQDEIKAKNLAVVEQELAKAFGTEAKTKVDAKAKELNLSEKTLESMAAESPTAFLTLMGQSLPKAGSPIVESSVNLEAFQSSGKRGKTYYDNLRKTNQTQYFSAKVQQQRVVDRQELGSEFYNN